jgi:hypothetical protein
MAENDILMVGGGDHKSGEVDDADGPLPCARRMEGNDPALRWDNDVSIYPDQR